MKAKSLVAAWCIIACLSAQLGAQTPSAAPTPPPARAIAAGKGEDDVVAYEVTPIGSSRWIRHCDHLCDGDGVSPPIGSEIYLYTGASFPFGGQYLGNELKTGWMIGGGLRTLFFNPTMDRAWVVDGGLSHYNNRGQRERQFPLQVIDFVEQPNGQIIEERVQFGTPIRPGLLIRDTDRTFVSLGVGRDFYFKAPADDPLARKTRLGFDSGGRYGTLSQEYDRIRHRTDVIGAFYAGMHYDLEVPSKWGVLVLGSRVEYSYTWSDILQRKSDIQEINTMLSVGFRY